MKKYLLIFAIVIGLVIGITHAPLFTSSPKASAAPTTIQDMHGAKVVVSIDQAIGEYSTWGLQDILWDTAIWNIDGEFNPNLCGCTSLQAKIAGRYLIHSQIGFQSGFNGMVIIGIYKNGVLKEKKSIVANGSISPVIEISTVDNAALNDVYNVKIGQTTGTDQITDHNQTSFSITLLSK